MKNRINITAKIILKAALLSIVFTMPALASYVPFNTNVRMNVGIGSANPGQSLDVQGTVRATAFIGNGAQLTGITSTVWTTTNTNDVYLPNSGNVGIGTSITSAGAALSVMNGNVGIGTWVPQAVSLNVVGGNVGIGTNLNNHAMLEVTGNGAKELFRVDHSGQNDTAPFIIQSDGNVGIGTTAPGAPFQLGVSGTAGNVRWVNNGTSSYFGINDPGNSLYYGISVQLPSPAGASTLGGYYKGLGIGGATNGASNPIFGVLTSTEAGNGIGNVAFTIYDTNQVVTYHNTLDDGNGNVGIGTTKTSAAGLTVMNGNVGIGTWVPSDMLTINGGNVTLNGASATDAFIRINTLPNGTSHKSTLGLCNGYGVGGNCYGYFEFDNQLNTYSVYQAYSSGYLGFGTNSRKHDMIVDINGNVGIGTTTPVGGLAVMNGNVGIGTWVPGGSLIVKGGNVGLGSNNPGQVLDVTGTVRATAFIGNGAQLTGVSSTVWTTINTNDVYLPNSGNVGIGTTITSAGAALTVMNGNVGIGTWVPSAKLAVKGGAAVFDAVSSPGTVNITGSSDGAQYSNFFLGDDADAHVWSFSYRSQVGDAHSFMIWNYNGSSFTNVADFAENGNVYLGGNYNESNSTGTYLNVVGGNVGVGLIAPEALLHVYGTLKVGGASNQQTGVIALGDDQSTGTYNGLYRGGIGTLGSNNYLNVGGYQGVNITTGNASFGSQGVRMVVDVNGNVGIGTTSPIGGLSVMNGNVGIGTWVPATTLAVVGTISSSPSATTNITAGGGITVTRAIMRIQGSGGAVIVTANPEIAAGQDGQIVVLEGMSSTNTVKLTNGTGLRMAGGVSFTLDNGATITFIYDATNSVWTETSRSAN